MKLIQGNKLIPMLFAVMLVISLGVTAVAGNDKVVKGKVVTLSPEEGKIVVLEDGSNKLSTYRLADGSDINLAAFSKGDKVKLVCTNDGVIKSIEKEKS